MAPLKRKLASNGPSSQDSNKRTKVDNRASSSKIRKVDGDKKVAENSKTFVDSPKSSKPAQISILAKDQPAFPRGGSLLTPLERKQIRARVNKDAIAEQAGSSDLFGASKGFEDTSDEDTNLPDTEKIVKTPRQKSRKVSKGSALIDAALRIEGLKFKASSGLHMNRQPTDFL
jgi:hypothetical protein